MIVYRAIINEPDYITDDVEYYQAGGEFYANQAIKTRLVVDSEGNEFYATDEYLESQS